VVEVVSVANAFAFGAEEAFSASLERVREALHPATGRIGHVWDNQ
jgi:hypothetical protein